MNRRLKLEQTSFIFITSRIRWSSSFNGGFKV